MITCTASIRGVLHLVPYGTSKFQKFCGLTIKDIDLKKEPHYQISTISFSELAAWSITSNPRKQMPVQESSNDGGRVPNVPGNFGRQANGFSGDYGGWLCGIPFPR
mgnify:CR=1 FL=1